MQANSCLHLARLSCPWNTSPLPQLIRLIIILSATTYFLTHHASSPRKQINISNVMLCKARSIFYYSTLITLYYACVYPYITYGIALWGSTIVHIRILSLNFKKKIVLRIITLSSFRAHTDILFNKTHILQVPKVYMYVYSVVIIMYTFNNNLLPSVFNNMY